MTATTPAVRAKFKVDSIKTTAYPTYPHKKEDGTVDYTKKELVQMQSIDMSPVSANGDPNHENSKFWAATPSGSLMIGTINATAAAAFVIGKEYYIDFTPAE